MKTQTNMSRITTVGLGIVAVAGLGANLLAQSAPVGTIAANTTLARVGASPTLNWSISYPQTEVTEVVEVGGGGVDTGGGTTSTVTAKTKVKVSVRVLGVAFGNGTQASNQWPCQLQMSVNGSAWKQLFVGRGSPITNEVVPSAELSKSANGNKDLILNTGDRLDFQFRGASGTNRTPIRTPIISYMSDWKWGYSWVNTSSTSSYKVVLKNGDTPPSYAPAFSNQGTIKTYLGSTVKNGKVSIGPRDVIYLTECSSATPGTTNFDMQDIVWLVTFEETN